MKEQDKPNARRITINAKAKEGEVMKRLKTVEIKAKAKENKNIIKGGDIVPIFNGSDATKRKDLKHIHKIVLIMDASEQVYVEVSKFKSNEEGVIYDEESDGVISETQTFAVQEIDLKLKITQ